MFLPVTIHGGRFFHFLRGIVGDVLKNLPIVVMAMAAQDVDLDVDTEDASAEASENNEPKTAS